MSASALGVQCWPRWALLLPAQRPCTGAKCRRAATCSGMGRLSRPRAVLAASCELSHGGRPLSASECVACCACWGSVHASRARLGPLHLRPSDPACVRCARACTGGGRTQQPLIQDRSSDEREAHLDGLHQARRGVGARVGGAVPQLPLQVAAPAVHAAVARGCHCVPVCGRHSRYGDALEPGHPVERSVGRCMSRCWPRGPGPDGSGQSGTSRASRGSLTRAQLPTGATQHSRWGAGQRCRRRLCRPEAGRLALHAVPAADSHATQQAGRGARPPIPCMCRACCVGRCAPARRGLQGRCQAVQPVVPRNNAGPQGMGFRGWQSCVRTCAAWAASRLPGSPAARPGCCPS